MSPCLTLDNPDFAEMPVSHYSPRDFLSGMVFAIASPLKRPSRNSFLEGGCVDVFSVISGDLISGLLVRELEHGERIGFLALDAR